MSYLTDYPFLNTTGIDPLPLKERGPWRERGEEGGRKERWGRMGRDIFPSKGKSTVKPRVFINQYEYFQ